jgi:hypothetical protein
MCQAAHSRRTAKTFFQGKDSSGRFIYLVDSSGNVSTLGQFEFFNGLPLVSHGLASQVARFDALNQGGVITNQLLYTSPAVLDYDGSPYSGFYRMTYTAKVTQVASSSSMLGGSGGITFTYISADDGQTLSTIPGVLNGNVNHNDLTSTVATGTSIVYAQAGTNITFSFGYTSSGATPMQYALHIRVEDL